MAYSLTTSIPLRGPYDNRRCGPDPAGVDPRALSCVGVNMSNGLFEGLPEKRERMNHGEAAPNEEAEMGGSVSGYYDALTEFILKKNPETLSIHRGLWGPGTKANRQGLDRANRTLTQGCGLGPGKRVLDAGCGVGGTAITLAEEYGVRVTGLTNCGPHVAVAAQKAQERGVGHLVEFLEGDFMDLPFADESFDAVLNQESFCYAVDKPAYLQGVYRVLKPGGRWQALDGELLSGAPMTEAHRALLAALERDWRMPPIVSWRDVPAMLEEAGFTGIEERDLSAEAQPSAERTRKDYLLFSLFVPEIIKANPAVRKFLDGAVYSAQGLSEGVLTYRFLSGRRPMQ